MSKGLELPIGGGGSGGGRGGISEEARSELRADISTLRALQEDTFQAQGRSIADHDEAVVALQLAVQASADALVTLQHEVAGLGEYTAQPEAKSEEALRALDLCQKLRKDFYAEREARVVDFTRFGEEFMRHVTAHQEHVEEMIKLQSKKHCGLLEQRMKSQFEACDNLLTDAQEGHVARSHALAELEEMLQEFHGRESCAEQKVTYLREELRSELSSLRALQEDTTQVHGQSIAEFQGMFAALHAEAQASSGAVAALSAEANSHRFASIDAELTAIREGASTHLDARQLESKLADLDAKVMAEVDMAVGRIEERQGVLETDLRQTIGDVESRILAEVNQLSSSLHREAEEAAEQRAETRYNNLAPKVQQDFEKLVDRPVIMDGGAHADVDVIKAEIERGLEGVEGRLTKRHESLVKTLNKDLAGIESRMDAATAGAVAASDVSDLRQDLADHSKMVACNLQELGELVLGELAVLKNDSDWIKGQIAEEAEMRQQECADLGSSVAMLADEFSSMTGRDLVRACTPPPRRRRSTGSMGGESPLQGSPLSCSSLPPLVEGDEQPSPPQVEVAVLDEGDHYD